MAISSLLAGDAIITFDNSESALRGPFLCQALTQQSVKVRPLGVSALSEIPMSAAIFATGNNLQFDDDITRRVVCASIDPRCEHPENRTFSFDPIRKALDHRGELLVAALMVLRAFHLEGRPQSVAPLASFADWSQWVRGALIWLGEADPCETIGRVCASDPTRQAAEALLRQWHVAFGTKVIGVSDLVRKAGEIDGYGPTHPELHQVLSELSQKRGALNATKIGKWLGRNKGRIVAGLRLVQEPNRQGSARWRVEAVGSTAKAATHDQVERPPDLF